MSAELENQEVRQVNINIVPIMGIVPSCISYVNRFSISLKGAVATASFGRPGDDEFKSVFSCDLILEDLIKTKSGIEQFLGSQKDNSERAAIAASSELFPHSEIPSVNSLLTSRIDKTAEIIFGYYSLKIIADSIATDSSQIITLPVLPLAILRSDLDLQFSFLSQLQELL
jgi:hypothetical protein